MLNFAIVGCGKRGQYIGSLFHDHPRAQVVAVVDPHEPSAREAGETFGVEGDRVYTAFDALLADGDIDAMLICSDPREQVDQACRAMEQGIHACTEVPACFTIDDCWRLINTVQATGMKYQLMEQIRYSGWANTFKQMHDAGEFGHICYAHGEYIHYEDNWNYWIDAKTGENIYTPAPPGDREVVPSWRMMVLGEPIFYLPHTLSPLLHILGGDRVTRVSCMGTRKHSYTYDHTDLPSRDIQFALMHTANDTVLNVGAGFSLPYIRSRHPGMGAHWYELRGSRASAESPRRLGDGFSIYRHATGASEMVDLPVPPLDATAYEKDSGHGGLDARPVDLFVRAILDDTPLGMDVFTAVETAAPAICAVESCAQGGALIEVPDFRAT